MKQLNPAIKTKSGLMLGLGETREELFDTLADLLDAGCDLLTLGQYLQPTPAHLPVVRYVPPDEFDELGRAASDGLSPRGQRPVCAFELPRPRNGGITALSIPNFYLVRCRGDLLELIVAAEILI